MFFMTPLPLPSVPNVTPPPQLRLAKLRRDVGVLAEQYQKASAEAARGELRLELAEKLMAILRNEGLIWKRDIEHHEYLRENLIGDSIFAAVI